MKRVTPDPAARTVELEWIAPGPEDVPPLTTRIGEGKDAHGRRYEVCVGLTDRTIYLRRGGRIAAGVTLAALTRALLAADPAAPR